MGLDDPDIVCVKGSMDECCERPGPLPAGRSLERPDAQEDLLLDVQVATVLKPLVVCHTFTDNPGAGKQALTCRTRGGRLIVRDLDMQMRSGNFVVMQGASGVGKTTIVRCLRGIDASLCPRLRLPPPSQAAIMIRSA